MFLTSGTWCHNQKQIMVKLISTTTPNIDGIKTAEELIVYIARVSNPSNQSNMQTAPKLIQYMIQHKHWSPFEMAEMTIEIVTSKSISDQIIRHRSFSFQEFSQRYALVTNIQPLQLRKAGAKNRQSSSEVIQDAELERMVEDGFQAMKTLYDTLIDRGVAKECARGVLPINSETRIYMKGSVRSWIHYFQVRCHQDTQLEHQQIAEQARAIFVEQFPIISGIIFAE